jgi:beta-aspartyl-peptidase (threonine type)
VFHHEGGHELDASIMSGADLSCGAVAGVTRVRNPISLARRVMERTPHVLLSGPGADTFAETEGVELVGPPYFRTDHRWRQLQEALAASASLPAGGGTVGAVALDRRGDLAAGTSTGGLTNKMRGRIGDSPIVGAGTYAQNGVCAVSGTGRGEEFIRHGVARTIALLVEREGLALAPAARHVVHERLRPGDGGVVAVGVGADGAIVLEFNTAGMYRGAADASGRFETHVGE